jgi:hypothetical protein
VAALAGSVALQPCETAACVYVEEVGLRGLPDGHGNIEVAALTGRKRVSQMPQFWKLFHTGCMYYKILNRWEI